MTLKDLFDTFYYGNKVKVMGNPCGWTNEKLEQYVEREHIPPIFEPYFNNEVLIVDIATYCSGQCCGIDIESPYLEITIK